jgi:adenylate cyclase
LALPLSIGFPVVCAFVVDFTNFWFPAGAPIIAGSISVIGCVILNYATEGRQKRYIKGAFKQYISPAVIDRLLDDPSKLELGGEEKVLSILFSDIQGFTTISEKLPPTDLTRLLNEYLTAMTDIILAAGGTIDKYEGDATIAFWNAPLDQPDHDTRAVKAAIDCQTKLQQMRSDLQQRYGCLLHARIGINTGPVVVGNMGSNQRFDYTFLGDAGNLASRLEGINKQFGTDILISEYTCQQLQTHVPMREIARVRVVGKDTPITIFEPFTQPPADTTEFDQARDHFQNKEIEIAKKIFARLSPKDPVSKHYLSWCEQYAGQDPTTWDGIIQLKEK